ncbi:amidohydrolase family protein [Streptomyces sp. NPDC048106]|uniref:amidohydrolase family protein n=1 Tax=Streptomyces sp. NPDC048106 TaxID=3155750 RepID=UPI0034527B27
MTRGTSEMAYKGTLVLDVHGHVTVPPGANNHLVQMLGSNQPFPSPIGQPGKNWKHISEEEFRKAAQIHVDYIDARNIDVQVIGPRPFLQMGWMEPHIAPAWAAYNNDMIAQQVSFFPERFVGAAQLPFTPSAPDTEHLLPELDRAVEELGFVAAYVSPDASGTRAQPGMDDPWWFPLYERAEELDVPLIVHGTNTLDPRFRRVPMNYQLAFLTEQYLAGQFLSHGDVFERFPRLRIIICHCGGALDRFIPTDHHIAQKDLSANLFYDSCGYDLNFLEAAIKQRGVNRVVFGTEAPGSGGAVRPETGRTSDDLVPVLDGFGFLTDADRKAILHDNPLRVVPGFVKSGRVKPLDV